MPNTVLLSPVQEECTKFIVARVPTPTTKIRSAVRTKFRRHNPPSEDTCLLVALSKVPISATRVKLILTRLRKVIKIWDKTLLTDMEDLRDQHKIKIGRICSQARAKRRGRALKRDGPPITSVLKIEKNTDNRIMA